jgi:hypothetical protein
MKNTSSRSMTKSPIALARMALQIGEETLEPYSSTRSKHDFTQAQHFAILVLRGFMKQDYRGIVEILKDFTALQQVLKLKKVPHYTTLQKAEARLLKKGLSTDSSRLSSSLPTHAA